MSYKTINANSFTPMKNDIYVSNLEKGMQKTSGGIILADDDMKDHGIKPRWGKIWKTGTDVDYVSVGEWVYVEHGRWTLGMDFNFPDKGEIRVWKIDPDAILLVSSDEDCPSSTKAYTINI